MTKNSGVDGKGHKPNWARVEAQAWSAHYRKCPKCGRKSAIKKRVELVGGVIVAERWCRYPDCDYREVDIHRPGK